MRPVIVPFTDLLRRATTGGSLLEPPTSDRYVPGRMARS